MQIATDAHVTIRYALTIDGDGSPDCDADGQVTEFITGRGQILPGLEAKLAGLEAGKRLEVTLPPGEAFGEHDPTLDLRLPFSEFPDDARQHIQPGVRFRGPHPSDPERVVAYVVNAVEGEEVVASGNHPLAGKALRIAAEILAVREATEEELSGGGGCCGGGSCGSGSCGSGECGSGGCGEHEHEHGHEHAHEHKKEGGGCGSGGCGCH